MSALAARPAPPAGRGVRVGGEEGDRESALAAGLARRCEAP